MKLLSRTLAVKTYEMIYKDTSGPQQLLIKSRKFNRGIELSVRGDSDIINSVFIAETNSFRRYFVNLFSFSY